MVTFPKLKLPKRHPKKTAAPRFNSQTATSVDAFIVDQNSMDSDVAYIRRSVSGNDASNDDRVGMAPGLYGTLSSERKADLAQQSRDDQEIPNKENITNTRDRSNMLRESVKNFTTTPNVKKNCPPMDTPPNLMKVEESMSKNSNGALSFRQASNAAVAVAAAASTDNDDDNLVEINNMNTKSFERHYARAINEYDITTSSNDLSDSKARKSKGVPDNADAKEEAYTDIGVVYSQSAEENGAKSAEDTKKSKDDRSHRAATAAAVGGGATAATIAATEANNNNSNEVEGTEQEYRMKSGDVTEGTNVPRSAAAVPTNNAKADEEIRWEGCDSDSTTASNGPYIPALPASTSSSSIVVSTQQQNQVPPKSSSHATTTLDTVQLIMPFLINYGNPPAQNQLPIMTTTCGNGKVYKHVVEAPPPHPTQHYFYQTLPQQPQATAQSSTQPQPQTAQFASTNNVPSTHAYNYYGQPQTSMPNLYYHYQY